MDKDLIVKLIRLANNNPNENEANMAARKACKLLGESDFMPSTSRRPGFGTPDNHGRSNNPTWQPSASQEEWFGSRTRNRTTEEEEANRGRPGQQKPPPHRPWNPAEEFDFDFAAFARDFVYGSAKDKYDSRIKKCIHCRKIMTSAAEIANKMCADCYRKEKEKYGQ